jgi:hypothetical protein
MSGNLKLAFVIEALDKATGPLSRIGRSIDKIGEPIRRIGALSSETAFRFGRFMGNRLQNQMGEVRERFSKTRDAAQGLAQTFGAVSLAAGGVFWALKRTMDETDRSSDVAKKLGITVEMYQRLGYAAQLNGSDQETMGMSLQFLSQNMVEAINGSKEAATWFARVGIPLNQLKKMNVVEVFEKISDKFLKVGDAGQNAEKKIAVMKALMGRSGAELRQVLDQGSEGLKKFYAEADKMGAVVSGSTADAMGDFNDNFDRMKFSIFGVMSSIAQHALPALDGLVQRFTALNSENREEWGKRLGTMIGEVVDALPGFLKALGQITGALVVVATAANAFAQVFGGWENLILGISIVMGAKLAFSIYGLGKAILTMIPTIWSLGVALMSTPLGWFLAAIAAIIGLVVLIYKNWEPIKQFFADIWGGIKSSFIAVYDWIMGKIMAVVEMAAKVGSAVKGIFSSGSGGGASYDAMGLPTSGVDAMSALPAGRGQKSEVGGTIRLQIDQDGRARVAEVKKNNPAVDFDVYSGMSMAAP